MSTEEFKVTKLAIMAVGGQGGGVLANWIVALLENSGWRAQLTSVAGVAQRTGATIYYIEMAPNTDAEPVFALIPAPGDVDIVLAAELMEAGRAVQRGLVTEDRTTLIASTHRMYAVSEKTVPGDGIFAPAQALEACKSAAKRFVHTDLDRIAVEHASVISASLFGALCAAQVLPFERAAFEDTIRAAGRGIEASLSAFAAAHEAILAGPDNRAPATPKSNAAAEPRGPDALLSAYRALMAKTSMFPAPAREITLAGLRKLCDYQDIAYAQEYLARVDEFRSRDEASLGEAGRWQLTVEAARQIANAMTYDDVVRVADLKTRESRFERVAADAAAADDEVLHITEYFHPRAEEVLATLPAGLSHLVEGSGLLHALVRGWFSKGRRVRSDTFLGFLSLYLLSGLRRYRRKLRRHAEEMAHMEAWLAKVRGALESDYELAVQLLRARRLIKGYSDTHQRGKSKFDRVIDAAERLRGLPHAARKVHDLIAAARQDEHGKALDELLQELPPRTAA